MKNPSKMHKNPSEIDQKRPPESMKMGPWTASGAKSRPGRLQDAPRDRGYSTFGVFLAENGAPRLDLGSQENRKSAKTALWRLGRHFGPRKMVSGRGLGKNMEILCTIYAKIDTF